MMKNENQKINLILFLFISFFIFPINSFKCGTDKIKVKPIHFNRTENYEKRRLVSQYHPIDIGIDFSSFIKPSNMDSTEYEKAKSIITETANEFKRFLQVQHIDIEITEEEINSVKDTCEIDLTSKDYKNFLIDHDIVFFPVFNEEMRGDALAAATICATIGKERPRPIFGAIHLPLNLSFSKNNTNSYMKNIFLHEMTHILVFYPDLLKSLGMVKKSGSINYIISKNALLKARQHFNCKKLDGIPLEDQGGSGSIGSHWEARYMLGDYMTSTLYIDNALSFL